MPQVKLYFSKCAFLIGYDTGSPAQWWINLTQQECHLECGQVKLQPAAVASTLGNISQTKCFNVNHNSFIYLHKYLSCIKLTTLTKYHLIMIALMIIYLLTIGLLVRGICLSGMIYWESYLQDIVPPLSGERRCYSLLQCNKMNKRFNLSAKTQIHRCISHPTTILPSELLSIITYHVTIHLNKKNKNNCFSDQSVKLDRTLHKEVQCFLLFCGLFQHLIQNQLTAMPHATWRVCRSVTWKTTPGNWYPRLISVL